MKKLSLVIAALLLSACLLDDSPGPSRYHAKCFHHGAVIFEENVRDGYRSSSGMWVYARHDGTRAYISGDCVNTVPLGVASPDAGQ